MINEDYDQELDLCLNIVTESKYENIVKRILKLNHATWISLRNHILNEHELTKVSEKISVMWLYVPDSSIQDMVFIHFLNQESMEIYYCYYNAGLLLEKDS